MGGNDLGLSAIGALGSTVATYLAFLSVRQVGRLHESGNRFTRRHATVEFVSDAEHGIPALARQARPYARTRAEKRRERFRAGLQIEAASESRCIALEKALLAGHTIPAALLLSLTDNERIAVHRALFEGPYEYEGDEHRAIVQLFNLLEDIANGIGSRVYDVQVLNKMYGGLILTAYREHAAWVSWLRRRHGFRFYDQTERLIDELITVSAFERYNVMRRRLMVFLLTKRRIGCYVRLCESARKTGPLLDHKQLSLSLKRQDLREFADQLEPMALIKTFEIEDITGKDDGALKAELNKLVLNVLRDSNGVWPVGVLSHDQLQTRAALKQVDQWRSVMRRHWECLLGGFSLDLNKQRTLVGIVGLRRLSNEENEAKVWQGDIGSAVSGLPDIASVNGFFEQIAMPVKEENPTEIDFDRVAILRSLMVDPAYRKRESNYPVGRSLFREGLRIIREEWGRTCLLSVLADDPVTESAISIYRSEGGQYLGSARDRGNEQGHLMHFFVF